MAQKKKPATDGSRLMAFGLPGLAAVLTFALRLWFILEMRDNPFSTVSAQMIDPWQYHTWALDILHRSFIGTEVFFMRPLYPYLLAALYRIFGVALLPVQIFQAVLAAVSCLLLYDATRRIFNRSAALYAAFGFALTSILVFFSGTLLYVEITAFFSLLTLWLILVAGSRTWRWAAAGISFGLMTICRPELLILLPAFAFIAWRSFAVHSPSARKDNKERPRRAVSPILALVLCALGTIAVVPVRNLLVAGEPVIFTAHSGINLYYGWNPAADGTWQQSDLERTAGFSHSQLKTIGRTVDGKELSWSEATRHWNRRTVAYVVSNPGRALWLIGRKFLLFWADYEVPNNYYPETARPDSLALKLALVNFGLLAALGLVGIVLALRRRVAPLAIYPLLFVAAYLVSALAFYVLSRLRAPVMPFLLIFAGFAASELVAALRSGNLRRALAIVLPAALIYAGSALVPIDRRSYTSQAWTQAGNIYLTLRSNRAFDAFRKALEANPSNPVTRYGLFAALIGMGRLPEAEAEYRELIRYVGQDPRNIVLGELAGGRIAIARRDFPRALVHYRNAVALDPLNAENHYLMGLVYVSMDSLAQADAALSGALRIDPAHDAARNSLEMVRQRMPRK